MTKGEKRFNELKADYVKNYKRTTGKKLGKIFYEKGFVKIQSKISHEPNKHKISQFEDMCIALSLRKDFKKPLKNNSMQVFTEVLTDYTDPETGNITIDCFVDSDPNSEGRVVAEVTPDGQVVRGKNELITEADFQCPLVIAAIEEAKSEQEERKQKLVDDVIEDLKESLASGDYTVLDELLKFVPSKNLIQALPEEKWTDYPIEIK
jgi:di/tripeptidase